MARSNELLTVLALYAFVTLGVMASYENFTQSNGITGLRHHEEDNPEVKLTKGTISVILTNEATLHTVNHEYTPKDFPEVNCVEVTDATSGTMRLARLQLEAERTGDWSALQDRINSGMWLNLDTIKRILHLTIADKSTEAVLQAADILIKRDDIYFARLNYIETPPSMPLNEVFGYLTAVEGGNSPDDPVFLKLDIDLGLMTIETDGWQRLLKTVHDAGKFVSLDLSDCTMNGTEFDPVTRIVTGKDKIVSLVLPNAATSISAWGFMHFVNLKTCSGANIKVISDRAFSATDVGDWIWPEYVSSLTSVSFPEAILIGDIAFYACTALLDVYFPKVKSIGVYAFRYAAFTDVDFPEAISIGAYAFQDCSYLININFPKVSTIGQNAFHNCTSLIMADFPSATNIDRNAFFNCTSLASVKFPASTIIADAIQGGWSNVFGGCTSLISFNLIGEGPLSVIEGGKALVRNNTELVAYPAASGNITLDSVTTIGTGAFASNTNLTGVSSSTVTNIGNRAFWECTVLVNANFPIATSIGEAAFFGCRSLTDVNIPMAINMGRWAFSGCTSLTDADFPLVTHISLGAFESSGSLAGVIFPAATIIDERAFSGCEALTSVTLGTIIPANFSSDRSFPGNLRAVYFAEGGGAGTYVRTLPSTVWTKQ